MSHMRHAAVIAGVVAALLARGGLCQTSSVSTAIAGYGPSAYTVPGPFPTSLYQSYYNDPTATSAEPQPVISDPVTSEIYPYWLTDPESIPQNDTSEPQPLPPIASPTQLLDLAWSQILTITTNPAFGNDSCARCQAALQVGQFLALTAPEQVSVLAVQLCEYFGYSTDAGCEAEFGMSGVGPTIAQVAAYADMAGYDGQLICANFASLCSIPSTSALNLTGWFAKPKPSPLPPPRQATGERLKVLHLSDLHIDPRYLIGSEANCSQGLCCRAGAYNEDSVNQTLAPAPRYGSFVCDAPYTLIVAALQAIPILTATEQDGFNFTLYTGDLVSHDPMNELSRQYTVYTETVLYDLIKRLINTGPVYAVLGNHDTYQTAQNSPYDFVPELAGQFDWDYDHLADLWELEGWISAETAQQARTNYAAYSVQRGDGLRIITLNTDFCTQNVYNYVNSSFSDNSGMIRFLTDELQDAEDAGERAWIMGHIPSGWDASDPLQNPTNLCDVDRYSPHVIAGIFFGHTHEDMLNIFYTNDATNMSVETAQTVAWIGPSVTPITNYNSGFRVYEVDSGVRTLYRLCCSVDRFGILQTFEVLDSYTWYSDVNAYPELDAQTAFGPTFQFEYSARETYGANITGWGPNDPLNATWWQLVTEAMEIDSSLVETFNTYQTKSSARGTACTGSCIPEKICSIRSGSASLFIQNCASL
ncbi:sphingomyelin phosphodiesterase [Laetiporus sulphureus 93-53]|uniref:Sphingomyelin phosphodiesterase n=1 Tax=Laetiporus sulphureus 93-53 TaxID=1314785 RepID=A0A165ESK5_9APHY|nr:sphingomyelin phosphodiesterase [Laetiporus sulphureus 93-53]KZT07671.1 sphingomyelin phosphodiesterase [Laetiporus sulphureus 93-53]